MATIHFTTFRATVGGNQVTTELRGWRLVIANGCCNSCTGSCKCIGAMTPAMGDWNKVFRLPQNINDG